MDGMFRSLAYLGRQVAKQMALGSRGSRGGVCTSLEVFFRNLWAGHSFQDPFQTERLSFSDLNFPSSIPASLLLHFLVLGLRP